MDVFQELVEYRQQLGLPAAGSESDRATIAKLEMSGERFFGINSSSNPNRKSMFISKFSVEDWQENQNKSSLKPVRGWQEIETVIKELDGHRRTLVTLEADGETHMAVGGGSGKYVVYLTFDNETFHYLVDPSKSDADENLIVGGQEGIYPAKLCVEIDAVLRAAKTFSELGIMERSLFWEQDGVFEPV